MASALARLKAGLGPALRRLALAAAAAITACQPLPVTAEADRAPWPEWAAEHALVRPGSAGDAFVSRGTEVLLMDLQVRLKAEGHVRFHRRAVHVSDRLGLEAAGQISIDYDPATESVAIHRIAIRRAGRLIPHPDLATTAIRREPDLGRGILDGRITLHAALPDLRVGDVVDIAWSVEDTHAIFPDRFHMVLRADPGGAVRRMDWRVTTPAERPLRTRIIGDAPEPAVEIRGAASEIAYGVSRADVLPRGTPAHDHPAWTGALPAVEIGDFGSWSEIARGLAPAYAPAADLPGELQLFAARTLAKGGTEADRVTEAFRLVQDRVRYVGIEIGAGGYLPRAPGLVWARGYGDCKDKALLLVSLLAAMGTGAEVLLVDAETGPGLPDALPSPYAFDHAIVRVRSASGASWFLDPTEVLQGGRVPDIAIRDYGWGLPLSPGATGLVPVTPPRPALPLRSVTDHWHFLDGGEAGAELTVTTRLRGSRGDAERRSLGHWPGAEREASYLGFYAARYPGIAIRAPLEIADDRDAGLFTITERYTVPAATLRAEGRDRRFWLNPDAVSGALDAPDAAPFSHPVALPAHLHTAHEVRLTGLPQPLDPPPFRMIETPEVLFTRGGERDVEGRELRVRWTIETRARAVAPDREEGWREALRRIGAEDNWRYDLYWRGGGRDMADRPALAGLTPRTWAGAALWALLAAGVAAGLRAGWRDGGAPRAG